MNGTPLPNADVKLNGNNIVITINNNQILEALSQKVSSMGKVVNTNVDNDGNFILTVDLSDIEDKYNNDFSKRFNLNGKFLEIENKTINVKIYRESVRALLEKLFKGMTVLDYKDRFEIHGVIDFGNMPVGMPFKM